MAKIRSEVIMPVAGVLLLHWLEEIKAAGDDPHKRETACAHLWWGTNALDKLATSLPGAVTFSVAASNEVRRARMIIMGMLDIDPTSHPMWKVA